MCLQLYIVARSHNHCCHESVTIGYHHFYCLCRCSCKHREVVSVVVEMHQWVPFALLPSYDVLHTAVTNYVFNP